MTISTRCRTSGTTLVFALCIFFLFSFSVFKFSCFSPHHPDLAWLDYDHDAESLIEATRIPKIISSEVIDRPSNAHVFQNDGEVIVGTDAPRHPLFDVLENATSEWMSLLDAHGGDQTHALLQYQLHHHSRKRRPVSKTSTPVSPLDIFTPISPSLLTHRQREAEILPDTFTLSVRSGVPSIIYGNLTALVSKEHRSRRVELLLDAIQPFVNSLPDLRATFNILPLPRHALPSHAVDVLRALSADQSLPNSPVKFRSQVEPTGLNTEQGRPIHADDLKSLESTMAQQKHWSWENACHAQVDIEVSSEEEEDRRDGFTPPIRFVASPEARSDACLHRAVTELQTFYESTDVTYHTRLSPIFSEITAPWASDVLLPSLDLFAPVEHSTDAIPWASKTAGLFWRGSAVEHPISYSVTQLRHLVAFTESSEKQEIIIPTDSEGFFIDRMPLRDVVTFNVQQGSEDTKTGAAWKFLIELGGAAQMRAKMASGSLVFRPLLLNDWISEQSVPWVHYVPVQPDLSDLPSLIAFFERHDALAQGIADAGQAWAREQLSCDHARNSVRAVLEGWARLGV